MIELNPLPKYLYYGFRVRYVLYIYSIRNIFYFYEKKISYVSFFTFLKCLTLLYKHTMYRLLFEHRSYIFLVYVELLFFCLLS